MKNNNIFSGLVSTTMCEASANRNRPFYAAACHGTAVVSLISHLQMHFLETLENNVGKTGGRAENSCLTRLSLYCLDSI